MACGEFSVLAARPTEPLRHKGVCRTNWWLVRKTERFALHLQGIADWGACHKTPVVLQTRPAGRSLPE